MLQAQLLLEAQVHSLEARRDGMGSRCVHQARRPAARPFAAVAARCAPLTVMTVCTTGMHSWWTAAVCMHPPSPGCRVQALPALP